MSALWLACYQSEVALMARTMFSEDEARISAAWDRLLFTYGQTLAGDIWNEACATYDDSPRP